MATDRPTDSSLWSTTPNLPDADAARAALAGVFTNALDAVRQQANQALTGGPAVGFDPADKVQAWMSFSLTLMTQPQRVMDAQLKAWGEWSELWSSTLSRLSGQAAAPAIEPQRGDRRFSDPAWSAEPMFDHIKQAYLLGARQLVDLVDGTDGLDSETRTRVNFMVRQYLDAVAPTNFAATNPAVVRRTLETGGVNLLTGLANLLADVAAGEGVVARRANDPFEIGVTIAATPGAVVFRNDLLELIQYTPSTKQASRRPMLYVPPLVNKYYLMDLQPKSSLMKWLVEQGRTVFVISWVNPGAELRDKDLASYVTEGVVAAMDAAAKATGENDADLVGFCMGGTLAATTAGYLASKGEGDRVGSLTLIGTLLDFSELGEWSVFTSAGDLSALRRTVTPKGYIDSHELQQLFSLMRANDLIWSSVVNHYLLDKEAPPSDILYWFADGARIPAAFLTSYGELILKGNRLREPGGVVIDGVPLDLRKVKAPVMLVSLKDDHVSAWAATYSGAKLFGGDTRFVLGGSGHNAGVINPPSANKHGFWTNDALPDEARAWMDGAVKNDGSWWPAWQAWLTGLDDALVAAREPGAGPLKAIEPAPGSYVRAR
ncbi:MAG TPA: alpha/beta fold hydrolase [Caulobacteraceae bacterium]|jgi:polyhydroxyalkanoate synthase|nr:alpha/beta fold hydrolase [Caulobacteraceae bacterium]